MTNDVVERNDQTISPEIIEQVVANGDLSKLTPKQRVEYYNGICNSLGLNPLTQPFLYIILNNKLRLYAAKECSEQLRNKHNVSITSLDKDFNEKLGLYIVTAHAKDSNGKEDESTGAVPITGIKGQDLANAIMKAETKAKRRVTLSICGLGFLDESEIDSIRDARRVNVDAQGNIVNQTPQSKPQPSKPMNITPPNAEPKVASPVVDLTPHDDLSPNDMLEAIEKIMKDGDDGMVMTVAGIIKSHSTPAEWKNASPEVVSTIYREIQELLNHQ